MIQNVLPSLHALIHIILVAPVSKPAAYLDPGSGSFILQILIATLVGGLFVIKSYWKKIISFFRRKPEQPEPSAEQPDSSEDQPE